MSCQLSPSKYPRIILHLRPLLPDPNLFSIPIIRQLMLYWWLYVVCIPIVS